MLSLADARRKAPVSLPKCLKGAILFESGPPTTSIADREEIAKLFPKTYGQPHLVAKPGGASAKKLKIGVVLSGGQAAGGHNVIAGLFDAMGEGSELIGFLNGPGGIVDNKSIKLTSDIINKYRNQGGFDMIGSGRTKIETEEQKEKALAAIKDLDGLVVIGGDDSNTNAAMLAEYALQKGVKTRIIGVPKTIDGDLRTEDIAISFGFDTATKTYAEMIGNLGRDALSAKKYFHFVKLMGRSASHIALECALKTHPNLTLIGEEIAEKGWTLSDLKNQVADLIEKRAEKGKNYGIVLVPEGTIEFIPEMKKLISELNRLLAESDEDVAKRLSESDRKTLESLPEKIGKQLLLDRDPHGNVQVSHIATEELLLLLAKQELEKRGFKGKFSPVCHFFGYEGRAGLPSVFDATYCYALGTLATHLIAGGYTGYMSAITKLKEGVDNWGAAGIPITSLFNMEERKGKQKPVIQKALVDLKSDSFKSFEKQRGSWKMDDAYQCPGPIQFFGDSIITDNYPLSI